MDELRGGIIGTGTWSGGQLQAWQSVRGARIVAVCDTDPARRDQAARQFAIDHAYADAAEMLEREQLDFVDICTRPASHAALVRLAAGRRVHILCQKPFCTSLPEAEEAVDLAEQSGVRLMVNENYRWQGWYRSAREAIDRGLLGRPFLFSLRKRARITMPRFEHRQAYLKDMLRLVLYEVGVHYVDVARFLLGEPQSVFARTHRIGPDIAGEDVAVATLSFAEATAVICTTWASFEARRFDEPSGAEEPFAPQWQIDGTDGTLALFGDGRMTLNAAAGATTWQFDRSVFADSQRRAQQHFVDSLGTGTPFETSGRDTLRTLAAVYAAYDSARRGQAVPLQARA